MSTTEEIVVKYRLELDELKAQVEKLLGEYKKADDAAKTTAKNSEYALGKLGDKLKDLGKAVTAAFAVEKIISFGKESVAAFAEAEKGALKLRSAVTASGGLQKDFERLTAQAEELAGVTIFDDDQVKAAQTLALQFGLNSKAVERLLPKVLDFAAATGQDLQQALQAVLGGINGQVDGLKRFGIQLDVTSTRNERFGAVVDSLTEKFNGQAEALTQTLSGSIGQAEKAFGELQETVGAALAPAVTAAAQAVTGLFNQLNQGPTQVQGLEQEIVKLGTLTQQLNVANTSEEDRVRILQELKTNYPDLLGNLDVEKTSQTELQGILKKVNEQLVNKLVLAKEDEKVNKAIEIAGNFKLEQLAEEEAAYQALAKAQEFGVKLGSNRLTLEQKLQAAVIQLEPLVTKGVEGAGHAYSRLTAAITGVGYATKDAAYTQNVANIASEKRENLAKRLGLTLDQVADKEGKAAVATKTGLEQETEAEKKAREEREKAAAEARQKALDAVQKQAAEELKVREQLSKDELAQDLANVATNDAERRRAVEGRYDAEANAAKAAALQQQADLLAQLQQGLITYEDYTKKKEAIAKAVPDFEKQKQAALLQEDVKTLELQLQNQADYGVQDEKLIQDLADKKAALAQLTTEQDQAEAAKRLATAEDEAKTKDELLKKEEETRKAANERTLELAGQLFTQLAAFATQQTDQQVEELTRRRDEQAAAADEDQATLDEQLQKRLISQANYEAQSAALKNKRAESEKAINEKINALKKRQDALQKAQAIFSIGVDTAKAIQAQLALTPLPAGAFFVSLIAASGLAQLGAVLAQKPPQYAEGVDWVPLGKNRPGRDTIPALLDEGERVVSRRKNLRHWDLYQAIDEDRLDQYVFQRYTLPTLLAEKARGGEVGRALGQLLTGPAASPGGLDVRDLRRALKGGVPITNLDELADLLGRHQASPYRA